ncbi:MAG: hypothetical protein WBP44_11200, partial [Gammaproteobacteria bacterium]
PRKNTEKYFSGFVTIQHTTETPSTQRRFVIKSCENDKKQDPGAFVYAIFPGLIQSTNSVFSVPPW